MESEHTKTPAEIAAERFNMPSEANSGFDWYDDECDKAKYKRHGFSTCYTEHVIPLLARIAELEKAGQAVVDRWDSPLWKDLPHTGEFINALRNLLPTK